MSRLNEFLTRHWELSLALALVTAAIGVFELWRRRHAAPSASPGEATLLMNREQAQLVDVREAAEYGAGHIRGAVHIPLSEFKARIRELEKARARPVIVYCRSGQRSAQAAVWLQQAGFSRAHHLAGGLLAWENAHLPVTKD